MGRPPSVRQSQWITKRRKWGGFGGCPGRSRRHERGDQRRHRRVLRYGINPKTALRFPSGLRAGWIGRRPGSRPRRSLPPPFGCDCACQVSIFFERDWSSAFFRISTSRILRLRCAPVRGCGPPSVARHDCRRRHRPRIPPRVPLQHQTPPTIPAGAVPRHCGARRRRGWRPRPTPPPQSEVSQIQASNGDNLIVRHKNVLRAAPKRQYLCLIVRSKGGGFISCRMRASPSKVINLPCPQQKYLPNTGISTC